MDLDQDYPSRLNSVGHRRYVGGADAERWYGIGKLQYHFLVSRGLRHDHTFLDIGCGSLRLGQFLIPYLDAGKYFGLDVLEDLVSHGLNSEFYHGICDIKHPHFAFNSEFDVSFCPGFDYAIAQSLITHLTIKDIHWLLCNLRETASPQAKLYVTYFRGASTNNPLESDPHQDFHYSFEEVSEVGLESGWRIENIGDWNHPANQQMLVAMPH